MGKNRVQTRGVDASSQCPSAITHARCGTNKMFEASNWDLRRLRIREYSERLSRGFRWAFDVPKHWWIVDRAGSRQLRGGVLQVLHRICSYRILHRLDQTERSIKRLLRALICGHHWTVLSKNKWQIVQVYSNNLSLTVWETVRNRGQVTLPAKCEINSKRKILRHNILCDFCRTAFRIELFRTKKISKVLRIRVRLKLKSYCTSND